MRSLELLEGLMADRSLQQWAGLGIAVQAYQKRAPALIEYLMHLASKRPHPLMVRLVKGAYWDAEIKLSQVLGFCGYPVYTRKVHTDVAYLACARRLLAARTHVRPQFATHNADTVAEILELASGEEAGEVEFQCLHGHGCGALSGVEGARSSRLGAAHLCARRSRARRCCRIWDATAARERRCQLVRASGRARRGCEMAMSIGSRRRRGSANSPHPRIPLPRDLFLPERRNSSGLDLADSTERAPLERALEDSRAVEVEVEPMMAASAARALALGASPSGARAEICNPADRRDRIGVVRPASERMVDAALEAAVGGAQFGRYRDRQGAPRLARASFRAL